MEAALVDHSPMQITALDPRDTRVVQALVAGEAALFVDTRTLRRSAAANR